MIVESVEKVRRLFHPFHTNDYDCNYGKRGKGRRLFHPSHIFYDYVLWKAWKKSVDFSTLPTANDKKGAPRCHYHYIG